ncbi:YheC/YheD family protein [Bacillus luteolus]|uniref:YheC/YheD family protein n=1 Tax=Litchfieldia luteola TaxID=682179 RepID=A0ABR9QE95_9BACI|nr:YheC/YheD family protein [Cytobacillus luteolus]MBE4906778.1 YheC/YheD family protein [Cytobacillus luteolus]MBP1940570.1 glutathione synthase/RimK-type ligase-like ATP-grasp enzyme [Cytobacillus luteolus]
MRIKLYYDPYTRRWVQNESEDSIKWGHNFLEVTFSGSIHEKLLPFNLAVNGKVVGPIVGVLAGEGEHYELIGNPGTFLRLHHSLSSSGALCVVFTPSSLHETGLNGYIYFDRISKWVKAETPLPNIVYNRIPFRKMEKAESFQDVLAFLHKQSIPYFNPFFFSKWNTFRWLWNNPELRHHLPLTKSLTSIQALIEMLHIYKEVYIKPSEGSKGKGIFKIDSKSSGEILLLSKGNQHSFANLNDLWEAIRSHTASSPYIIQQAIQSDRINGKRYDLRLLVHSVATEKYQVSGIGVRMAGEQEITTHIPNGGTIYPYEQIKHRIDEEKIDLIVNEIGKQLTKETNSFIGEFSIDLGKSADNHYYIYEVNSKPMVFDERSIKNKGLENLTKLLIMRASTP